MTAPIASKTKPALQVSRSRLIDYRFMTEERQEEIGKDLLWKAEITPMLMPMLMPKYL